MNVSEETQDAFLLLSKANPLDVDQGKYISLLLGFLNYKGEEALLKLAGFYIYMTGTEGRDDEDGSMLKSTFAHDLYGAEDRFMLPRSDSYINHWKNYYNKQ